jgi:hypothetical protein
VSRSWSSKSQAAFTGGLFHYRRSVDPPAI